MKFEKFAPILIVVLVLAAALMLAQGFGLFKRKTVTVDPTQVELQRVIKEDKENLAQE